MLKLPIKNPKKTRIHLNLKLKPQIHPWDIIGEQTREKAKHLEQAARTQEVAKRFRKNLISFNEGPPSHLSEVLIASQQLSREQNIENNEQLFSEHEDTEEGFFPCPACTCWFTNKYDLNFHMKKWCDR